MRPRMNVYLTTAKRVIIYAYPTIISLFENNQDSEIYLYIVSENLEETDIQEELKLAEEYGHHIIILRFDENTAKGKVQNAKGSHWPLGTLGCYWMFHELLPEDVDRIMALESDTVVIGSLREFYNTDLDGYYAACPDPQHKPTGHRKLMDRLQGDVLSFVVSLYDVKAIRSDFTLEKILEIDRYVVQEFGHSQQELTFGILFKDKIKFVPAQTLCVEVNRQSMQELGYEYLQECRKTCKVLHFSSFIDKGKPWDPICIMPGFSIWWKYAQGSPYYKEYFTEQWKAYDRRAEEIKQLEKNITYRNVLVIALAVYVLLMLAAGIYLKQDGIFFISVFGGLILSLLITLIVRKVSMLKMKMRK